MERLYSKIIGTPVFTDGPRPITTIKDVIVDPEQGKVIGFIVNQGKNLIITPLDILAWGEAIQVHSNEVIISGSEVLRVEEVQKTGIHILRNIVETKSGKYLGKVFDFSIDSNTFMLQKIFVAKGFLVLFRYESRIIPMKNVIEILPDKIVVKEDLKTVKEEAPEERIALEDMAVT